MSKSINVVLNSINALNANTTGSTAPNLKTINTNNLTYYFDWQSVLDRTKKYKMHWTYLGGVNTYTGTKLAAVYFTINSNSYTTSITNGAPLTQCIGFLKPIVLVGASNFVYLQAEDNTNLPIHLDSCPMSNTFTIQIRDNNGSLFLDNAATPVVPADYILSLKFTEVDELED